jgi:hypothetical protein
MNTVQNLKHYAKTPEYKIYYSLINSIALVIFTAIFCLYSNNHNFISLKKYFVYAALFFYTTDSIIELNNKNYLMIPHHIISIFGAIGLHFFNTYDDLLKNTFLNTCFMELTATLLCVRVILKDNDLLSLSYDSILLIIYMFFRNFLLAKFVVYDAKLFNFFKNDLRYRVVNIVSGFVYLMSFYWSIRWGFSIIKYNVIDKNKNEALDALVEEYSHYNYTESIV